MSDALPPGWEACWSDEYQRYYFQDHNTHTTSWDDPRLTAAPLEVPAYQAPEPVAPAQKPDPWDMHDLQHAAARSVSHDEVPCTPWDKAALNPQDHNSESAEQQSQGNQGQKSACSGASRAGKVWMPGMGWVEQPAAIDTGYEDFDPTNFEPPDVGEGETYIKDDKIVRMKDGSIYVGQVDYNKMPHGHGYLMLADGSQHVGHFEKGRAMGSGMAQMAGGIVAEGEWRDNRRYGIFKVLDGNGVSWTEKYNAEGKKTARKKVKKKVPNPAFGSMIPNPAYAVGGDQPEVIPAPETIEVSEDPGKPAQECWGCGGIFHEVYNNNYACRKHKGKFALDRNWRGEGEQPGVWTCCGSKTRADKGCVFKHHQLDHGQ